MWNRESPSLASKAWPDAEANADGLKAQYLLRRHALEQLATVLRKEKIPALVVKGAALAETLYPMPWLRAMADIDVLVDRHQLVRVHGALCSAGWHSIASTGRFLTQELLEVSLWSPGPVGSVLLELHLSLDKVVTGGVDIVDLFARAESLPGFSGLFVPSREDHVLLVSAHLASDEFRHLPGLVDLELLLASGVDLEAVVARASKWRSTIALYVALSTLDALRPGLVPAKTLHQITPARYRRALLSTCFNVGSWPVTSGATTLGWKWILRQTLLRDDTLSWVGGLGTYAARRLVERTAGRVVIPN